ncbi:hypothetical protein NBCG_03225 [Nocardioidaceae bacterium Broad-1]|nr:hypothetical protein NBCG_03225 [Nocardioidaceae bacterium Broad-1]
MNDEQRPAAERREPQTSPEPAPETPATAPSQLVEVAEAEPGWDEGSAPADHYEPL